MTRPHKQLRLQRISTFVASVALAGLGCEEPSSSHGLPPPTFMARPATIAPGDTFQLVFVLRNPTAHSVGITSAYGCLFFLQVFRGTEPVAMEGTSYYCTAALQRFELAPGDSLQVVQTVVAADADAPLPSGTYRIRTQMNAPLPDVEAVVTVAEPSGAT